MLSGRPDAFVSWWFMPLPSLLSDENQYQASLAKLAALNADLLLEGHYGIISSKVEVRKFIQSFMR